MVKVKYLLAYDSEHEQGVEVVEFFSDFGEAKAACERVKEELHPEILELSGKRWKLERNWKEYNHND